MVTVIRFSADSLHGAGLVTTRRDQTASESVHGVQLSAPGNSIHSERVRPRGCRLRLRPSSLLLPYQPATGGRAAGAERRRQTGRHAVLISLGRQRSTPVYIQKARRDPAG